MTRLLLALSIAALLLLFALLGWMLHWLWHRATGHAAAEEAHKAGLIARLHAAETARDAALAELALREADAARGAEAEILARHLAERDAELAATMEALRAARAEAAEWRGAYEALIQEERSDP